MKNKVLVMVRDAVRNEFRKDLEKLNLPDLEIIIPENEEEIIKNIWEVNILFWNPPITKKYIHLAKNLVWFQSSFAWIDSLCSPEMRKDYILTNVKETYWKEISEYIFWYLIMLEKQFLDDLKSQKNKIWNQRPIWAIKNKTIGIMWTWSIWKEIARIWKSFGMQTLWYRSKQEDVENFDKIYTKDSQKDFFWKSDYIVCVLPNTCSTNDIINKETLWLMKKECIFINVGRWASVNEMDLYNSLKNKEIAFAVLDVFKQEPLPENHPFWEVENIIITPHISWYISNNDRIIEIFCENYKKYNSWKELDYVIDFEKWY